MLAQTVACLIVVQEIRDSVSGEVENFIMKILNFETRRGGNVELLNARLITGLNSKPFRSTL